MRRKIEKEEGFQDAELVEKWSRKRLFVAFTTLLVLGGVGYFALSQIGEKAQRVLGLESGHQVNTSKSSDFSDEVRLPTKDDVNALLEQAKDQLSNMTADNITASQAAVQKIIQDLQSMQTGSQSPIGALCDLVCKK
jgi:hypothetical protein